jgi:hypothetical protein
MHRITMLAGAMLMAGGLAGRAVASEPVEVKQTVSVSTSPAATWALIQDFDGISKWLPPAASSPADKGNSVGSVRTITLNAPGSPTIVEKLTKYDAAHRSYSYDIVQVDPKVLPVVHYHSTITVVGAGKGVKGSKVIWVGKFDPPPGGDENSSAKAVVGTYRAGLDNIKAVLEK